MVTKSSDTDRYAYIYVFFVYRFESFLQKKKTFFLFL